MAFSWWKCQTNPIWSSVDYKHWWLQHIPVEGWLPVWKRSVTKISHSCFLESLLLSDTRRKTQHGIYIYFSVHLFPDFFFNADQAGLLTVMIRSLNYSLHLDFVFLCLGFLVLWSLSALFKIMLFRLAITVYSLKNESDCSKSFIECFKDDKRKVICIYGSHVHKILNSLVRKVLYI